MKVLVTGASGFVGKALVAALEARGANVVQAVRQPSGERNEVIVGGINAGTDWHNALQDCDLVFHLAGLAHKINETTLDTFAEYKKINVIATGNLARQAAALGVKRMVYVSSIKVNGEVTAVNEAYSETDAPAPLDCYGKSKLMAEHLLDNIARETQLEVVIVRSPLVYGPGVKGNLMQMLHVLKKGVPLPLASIHNRRSLIYVGNLADALILCATHPRAANRTWLVSDGQDISVPDLLRVLGDIIRHPARLFPCPLGVLEFAARVIGCTEQLGKITRSLCVDCSRIRNELGWMPPFSVHEGLKETAEWYRQQYQ